jgi:hypothetical protein
VIEAFRRLSNSLHLTCKIRGTAIPDPETFEGRRESYILVTGKDGEEYICPKSALKKQSDLSGSGTEGMHSGRRNRWRCFHRRLT